MARAWILLALCGCNRLLGLDDVRDRHVDAQQYDAPPRDPKCPPLGSGAPRFGEALHQIDGVAMHSDYVEAIDHSVMELRDDAGTLVMYTAGPGEALMRAKLDIGTFAIQDARLAGDGGFAILDGVITNINAKLVYLAIARDGTGTWTSLGTLPVMPSAANHVATPTVGPQRHLVYFDYDILGAVTLYELVGDAATWTMQDSYPMSMLGIGSMDSVSVTPDGLELVGVGYVNTMPVVFYADRAAVTDRFGKVHVITDVPSINIVTPYMTNNCSELYFEGLDRILYVQQE